MRIAKSTILTAAILCTGFATALAATNVSSDPATGEIIYKQSFKLKADFKDEDVYTMVNDWFKQSPGEFNRQNISASDKGRPSKNKMDIDIAFDNSQPVQSIDPASKKIVVRGLTKYYGGFGSCINVLYIEYYAVFQVKGHELVATISQIKYHHFNRRTYAPQLIYSWQGGKPFDSADKLTILIAQRESNRDFNSLNTFINNDMTKILVDIREALKKKNVLAIYRS